MIEETLKWAGVSRVTAMVDVGCGIGGSSRHILSMYPGGARACLCLSARRPGAAARVQTRRRARLRTPCGPASCSRPLPRARPRAGATAAGITLSPKQAARANALTAKAGMADRATFQVGRARARARGGGVATTTRRACVRPFPAWRSSGCVHACTAFAQSALCSLPRAPHSPRGAVHAQVGDALAQPFPDASFDLVWSMESGEHMPDKP